MIKKKTRCIGILTSGGDCPGLNAAIRGVAKAALHYGIKVLGIQDGFRGLVENRSVVLGDQLVSGILTFGGTFLGSSRDKPHKMQMGTKTMDMTDVAVENLRKLQVDCLVCLGGNGTQKNALRLHEKGGVDVMTLPKTIDNDVSGTDVTFGFDSAMCIATEAIDRLHTTATSHHRVIVCEVMGNQAGWLTLGAGIAGGADVILIPEISYDLDKVVEHILARQRHNKRFSIVAVSEGAMSSEEASSEEASVKGGAKKTEGAMIVTDKSGRVLIQEPRATRIAREIQQRSGVDVRATTLGHIQRGGVPSPTDRLLCTRMGTKAGQLLAEGIYNVMVAVQAQECVSVPLAKVAGTTRTVPLNHEWIQTARLVGTSLGD